MILILCTVFMTFQGHSFLFSFLFKLPKIHYGFHDIARAYCLFLLEFLIVHHKIFLSLFCQDFIPTFSVCLYQIDLMMYHLLLLFYLMITLVFIVQVGSFFFEPLSLQSILLHLVLLMLNLVIERELV